MDLHLQSSTLGAGRRQRGVTLFIALIVLVAMTLAGIGMMRSVDTGTIVAGNIGFRQSAVNAADQGLQAAYAWLNDPANLANLTNDNTAAGYRSSAPANEAPNWYANSAAWADAKLLNGGGADLSGNIVSYQIHRLCTVANCAVGANCSGAQNICGTTPTISSTCQGCDLSGGSTQWNATPTIHYRVTARAEGPRRSIAIVQSLMRQ
jgi:type IV pilus assembly protein PilX